MTAHTIARAPLDGSRGDHGWLGCCLTHDLTHERLADAADADRCDDCGTTVPAGTAIRQADDPQVWLCSLCDEEAAEVARDARIDEDTDWRAER